MLHHVFGDGTQCGLEFRGTGGEVHTTDVSICRSSQLTIATETRRLMRAPLVSVQ